MTPTDPTTQARTPLRQLWQDLWHWHRWVPCEPTGALGRIPQWRCVKCGKRTHIGGW